MCAQAIPEKGLDPQDHKGQMANDISFPSRKANTEASEGLTASFCGAVLGCWPIFTQNVYEYLSASIEDYLRALRDLLALNTERNTQNSSKYEQLFCRNVWLC